MTDVFKWNPYENNLDNVGNSILNGGGTPNSVLYIDSTGNIAQSPNLTFDDVNGILSVDYIQNVSSLNGLNILAIDDSPLNVSAGNGTGSNNGQSAIFNGGQGGPIAGRGGNIQFNAGTPNNGNGGNIVFIATSGSGTSKTGGNIDFTCGSGSGGGANGKYIFRAPGGIGVIQLDMSAVGSTRTLTFQDLTGKVPILDSVSSNTSAVTSGNGIAFATSTLTSGNLMNLSSTSTAATGSTQTVLNVSNSGANATASQITYGARFSNTHSGTGTTTNVAGWFSSKAATGSSFDFGVVVENGMTLIGASTSHSVLGGIYGVNGMLVAGTGGTGSIAIYDATTAAGFDFYPAGVWGGQFKINITDAYFWARGSRNFIVYLTNSLYQGLTLLNNGQLGIGNVSSPAAMLEVDSGTTTTITAILKNISSQSASALEIQNSSGTPYFTIGPSGGNVTFGEGVHQVFGTTTGTKIGTVGGSSGQKLAFYGSTPIVQPLLATGAAHTVDDVITTLQNLGLVRQS